MIFMLFINFLVSSKMESAGRRCGNPIICENAGTFPLCFTEWRKKSFWKRISSLLEFQTYYTLNECAIFTGYDFFWLMKKAVLSKPRNY